MADLSSGPFKNFYQSVLTLTTNLVTSSLKRVQDGAGNDTALSLSTIAAKIWGTLETTGNFTSGGKVTATRFVGSAFGVTNLGEARYGIRTSTSSTVIGSSEEVIIMNGTSIALEINVAPSDILGKEITIKNTNATTLGITLTGVTIDGNGASRTLSSEGAVVLIATSTTYIVKSVYGTLT